LKRILTISLVFLLLGWSHFLFAAESSLQKQLALQGRDLILARRYEEAEQFLGQVVHQYPDQLLGYFGFMALYQVRNLENFDYRFDPPYKVWESKGRELALRNVRDEESSAWNLFLAGNTLGISGFYRAHNDHWLTALRDGSLAVHALQRGYEKDATLRESLLGIGLYDYWRSHFTHKLKFLPFFQDKRESAKSTLQIISREANWTSPLAEMALAFIYFQEKNYGSTVSVTNRLLALYPRNVILKLLKGRALFQLKKYPEAVHEFEEIESIDPEITKASLLKKKAVKRGS